ncbi:hypothetical protein, partial [Brevibacillus agri]|uniref:hypothetical protein n=1 Tax=Brevibacillus agri TaxID=51101 RepID=UPI003D1D73E7
EEAYENAKIREKDSNFKGLNRFQTVSFTGLNHHKKPRIRSPKVIHQFGKKRKEPNPFSCRGVAQRDMKVSFFVKNIFLLVYRNFHQYIPYIHYSFYDPFADFIML